MIATKLKPKKCKAPSCGKVFTPLRTFQVACSPTCALELFKINQAKKEKKEWQTRKKAILVKVENWKKVLQTEVNKIVRLIDKGQLCLARNHDANQIHAGHVFARGGNSSMSYNLHNIHRQSAQSNYFQSDDGLLKEGIIREYGNDYLDFISDLRRTPELKYSNAQYLEFLVKAKAIVKSLTKENLTYSLDDRIRLRNEINLNLGIYTEEFCVFNQSLK